MLTSVFLNHLPRPTDSALDAAQGAGGLLCPESTWLVHGQLDVHQDPQLLLCRAAGQPVGTHPVPVLVLGADSSLAQDFAFFFLELHEVPLVSPVCQTLHP